MGLDLSFVAGDERFAIRFSNTDWELLSLLGNSCPNALEMLAGADDFGEPRTEDRAALLAAVDALLGRLEKEKDSLPYLYGHTIVEGASAGVSGSGTISGITMNADGYYYSLSGGLGRAVLESHALQDGKVIVLERKDVRHVRELQTDNLGRIKLWRKKKNTHLVRLLQELQQFLLRIGAGKVTKILG